MPKVEVLGVQINGARAAKTASLQPKPKCRVEAGAGCLAKSILLALLGAAAATRTLVNI